MVHTFDLKHAESFVACSHTAVFGRVQVHYVNDAEQTAVLALFDFQFAGLRYLIGIRALILNN